MRKDLLIIALGLSVAAGSALADVLATPEAPVAPTIELPKKGASMAEVQKKFGSPALRQKTVGGDSPKHPPITRWDYADFYVIFERDKTIDAVIPGKHPTVYNKDQLTPAAAAPVKPSAAAAAVQPAVPAEAPVMKTTEQPIAPAEGPATAAKMEPPQSEATAPAAIIPAPEPAAPEPAPAPAPAPAKPMPAPATSSGGPALANPVPDSPPTPK